MIDTAIENNITDIFREIKGDGPVQIESIAEGVMTYKFLVRIPEGKYVIRFYPMGREQIVEFEPDVIRQCREAGIKTPTVITDSRTGPKCDMGYMIYEYVDGQTLASQLRKISPTQLLAVSRELVEAIDVMACIRKEGFGEIVAKNRANSRSWQEFVEGSFKSALSRQSKITFCSKAELNKLEQLFREFDEVWWKVEPSLVFSDLRPENIILSPSQKLAAIIDFEGVLSGDPLLSLGYCYASSADDLFFTAMQQSWKEKYGTIDRNLLDTYAMLRIMRIVEYIDKPLPAGEKREPFDRSFPGFFKSLGRAKLNNTN